MQKYNYFISQPHYGIALILENLLRVCSYLSGLGYYVYLADMYQIKTHISSYTATNQLL